MLNPMDYVRPIVSREVVDRAGDALIDYADALEEFERAGIDYLDVISNWRLSHAYPLNTFQMALRSRTYKVDPAGIVAQRIKRPESIENKLRRMSELKLSEMQDIGGCRAIVASVEEVYALVDRYQQKYATHPLDYQKDYIKKPKSDGYRGYHLIYCYSNPKHPEYEGLRLEIQIRSGLQHCWATAVETVDTFLREGLKSHRGSPEWRRFFALMGSILAKREGTRRVPRTPTDQREIVDELRGYVEKLHVFAQLESFQQTLSVIPGAKQSRIKWVVLELDSGIGASSLKLYGYRASDFGDATERLEALERHKAKGVDAVLISVADAANIRNAYPNYWLDTSEFLNAVREAIA
jgi:ppGpp synthetase/RelA/SpoT-type nucleotidyltranferase